MKPAWPSFIQIPIGTRFGRLVVLSEGIQPNGLRGYLCQCDCGNTKVHRSNYLTKGRAISCNCAKIERMAKLSKTHGHASVGKVTQEYRCWQLMKRRCENPADESYIWYGQRGITVCERWHSFENFLADMGQKPHGHSIERIDNDGNYEPSNCRWATMKEQSINKRNTIFVNFRGQKMPLATAAELAGISYASAWHRANRDEPIE